jgi:MarR family transcriptional regulator, transcriptional regulator for hemolysin
VVPQPSLDAQFDPLGRQLNVTARATRGLLDGVLAQAGTTFSSWLVLMALSARGPAIQKELARDLDMIGPSVVERIDQLEASGHVVRSAVPEDRRAYLVSLTPSGKALFERLEGTMKATEAALVDGLTARDVATTRRVLIHITNQARALRGKS